MYHNLKCPKDLRITHISGVLTAILSVNYKYKLFAHLPHLSLQTREESHKQSIHKKSFAELRGVYGKKSDIDDRK